MATLKLKWRRVEDGLWSAGPYVVRRRPATTAHGQFWRIYRSDAKWKRSRTLWSAMELCAQDYAQMYPATPSPQDTP